MDRESCSSMIPMHVGFIYPTSTSQTLRGSILFPLASCTFILQILLKYFTLFYYMFIMLINKIFSGQPLYNLYLISTYLHIYIYIYIFYAITRHNQSFTITSNLELHAFYEENQRISSANYYFITNFNSMYLLG